MFNLNNFEGEREEQINALLKCNSIKLKEKKRKKYYSQLLEKQNKIKLKK